MRTAALKTTITVTSFLIIVFSASAEEVSVATWNVRFLSDNSRDDTELAQIAEIIQRYDFVAVQEARDTIVFDRLTTMLPGYSYVASSPVGRGQKEVYAFLYRDDLFTPLGQPYVFGDGSDLFIREPFVGHFRTGEFDFTFVTIHLLYGDSKADRREELVLMDEVVAAVDQANGAERDIILGGDFNFEADDRGWQLSGFSPVILPSVPTTITETSSYDNFWINDSATAEYVGLIEVYPFDETMFANNDEAASLAVSDHRPVAISFRTDGDDDDREGEWNTRAGLRGTAASEAPVDPSAVRIDEVVAHPTDAEAITLVNRSDRSVNLGGWVLGDENNPDHYRIPSTHTIPANGRYTFERSTFGFAINNSGETIYLKAASGEVIDTWRN